MTNGVVCLERAEVYPVLLVLPRLGDVGLGMPVVPMRAVMGLSLCAAHAEESRPELRALLQEGTEVWRSLGQAFYQSHGCCWPDPDAARVEFIPIAGKEAQRFRDNMAKGPQ